VVDVFGYDGPAAALGILAELAELQFAMLVLGTYAGVQSDALDFG
jgi:hypothetical protein